MDRARSAVVTIVTATGHGSGFFISRDGYLITNYHVVEEARIAKIVLASGREVRGTIVARNARRDVALIKVELSSVPALAVASRALKVGATIYAIGAPRDTAWAGTVSQGIVSAKRNIDGQNFIQGDVNIQQGSSGGPLIDRHGNVIAVSVSGLENRGTATGLNFFIPIDEALASLNVKLK